MVIDIVERRKQDIENDIKGAYVLRLSLDFLLEKGQFKGSLENKEEKFIEACKTMNFTEDMQVRINESIDDFLLLSDKDKDFSQYMMVIGANVLDNANDTMLVNSFADSLHEALVDRDDKRFDVVFDKIPGKEMKMYRYQLKESEIEEEQALSKKLHIRLVPKENKETTRENIER